MCVSWTCFYNLVCVRLFVSSDLVSTHRLNNEPTPLCRTAVPLRSDLPGAGEPIRWALEKAELEWTDKRVTREEFAEMKPSESLAYRSEDDAEFIYSAVIRRCRTTQLAAPCIRSLMRTPLCTFVVRLGVRR